MKEAGRRCHRCQYRWYATRPGPGPGKPRWYDEMGSFWTDGQARMARRVSNHDRHQQQVAAFEKCPNCGSMNVKTDKSRNFVPTGAITPAAKPGGQLHVTPAPAGDPNSPRPAPAYPAAGVPPTGPTVWQRIGRFHGRHWRIIWATVFAHAPLGSIGDGTTYKHGTVGNVLLFLVILAGSWAVAGLFLTLHLRHLRRG